MSAMFCNYGTATYDAEMIFKYMTFLYRKILSAGSTDIVSGHTDTHRVQQYKQQNDRLYGKERSVQ